jgi:hypothetical protein
MTLIKNISSSNTRTISVYPTGPLEAIQGHYYGIRAGVGEADVSGGQQKRRRAGPGVKVSTDLVNFPVLQVLVLYTRLVERRY